MSYLKSLKNPIFSFVLAAALFLFAGTSFTVATRADNSTQSSRRKIWIEPETKMEFVWIPGGCFVMGSPRGEQGRDPDEGPTHEVCLDGFWMGRFEATREQFNIFARATGYKTESEVEGFSWIYTGRWEKSEGFNWRNSGFTQDGKHPVVNVSWNDAKAMARWLSKKNKTVFRLPTEAEWEYACRAGTDTARYWGDSAEDACDYSNAADRTAKQEYPAWLTDNCTDGYVYTSPVGQFTPNSFGLYDMLGNVWEWCEDSYERDAYKKHKKKNPLFRSRTPDIVIRGGSWYSRPKYVRSASRDHLHTSHRRGNDVGFRLVIIPKNH